MTKLRTCARRALGKGADLRRSASLELMTHGGPAADPQVSADLSTIRVCTAGSSRAKWSGHCLICYGNTPLDLGEAEALCATSSKWLCASAGWPPR
eukprot:4983483-Amphidinium_carterae.1